MISNEIIYIHYDKSHSFLHVAAHYLLCYYRYVRLQELVALRAVIILIPDLLFLRQINYLGLFACIFTPFLELIFDLLIRVLDARNLELFDQLRLFLANQALNIIAPWDVFLLPTREYFLELVDSEIEVLRSMILIQGEPIRYIIPAFSGMSLAYECGYRQYINRRISSKCLNQLRSKMSGTRPTSSTLGAMRYELKNYRPVDIALNTCMFYLNELTLEYFDGNRAQIGLTTFPKL